VKRHRGRRVGRKNEARRDRRGEQVRRVRPGGSLGCRQLHAASGSLRPIHQTLNPKAPKTGLMTSHRRLMKSPTIVITPCTHHSRPPSPSPPTNPQPSTHLPPPNPPPGRAPHQARVPGPGAPPAEHKQGHPAGALEAAQKLPRSCREAVQKLPRSCLGISGLICLVGSAWSTLHGLICLVGSDRRV
jgi:hypothetical protein